MGRTHEVRVLNGSLYIVQNSRLHRVDPATGGWTLLTDTDWRDATSMTAAWGSLFIIQNNTLHRVDPNTGGYTVLGKAGSWPNGTAMIAR